MILSVLFSGAAQADFHQPGVLHEGVDTSARGVDETRKPIEEAELQEVKLQKAAERAGEYLEPMVIVSDLMEIASPEIREADLLLKKLTQVIGRIVKEVAFQADRFFIRLYFFLNRFVVPDRMAPVKEPDLPVRVAVPVLQKTAEEPGLHTRAVRRQSCGRKAPPE